MSNDDNENDEYNWNYGSIGRTIVFVIVASYVAWSAFLQLFWGDLTILATVSGNFSPDCLRNFATSKPIAETIAPPAPAPIADPSALIDPRHRPQLRACLGVANAYYSAVNRLGGDAYREAQQNAGC